MILKILNKIFEFFSRKNDAEELLDILSEKYKDHEEDFFNTSNFSVNINTLHEALIYYYKNDNGYNNGILYRYGTIHIRHKWYNFFIPINILIDLRKIFLKRKLKKENKKAKRLLDIKLLYDNIPKSKSNVNWTISGGYINSSTLKRFKSAGFNINYIPPFSIERNEEESI